MSNANERDDNILKAIRSLPDWLHMHPVAGFINGKVSTTKKGTVKAPIELNIAELGSPFDDLRALVSPRDNKLIPMLVFIDTEAVLATQGTIANDPSVLNADERNKFEGWYRAKYWDFKYGGEEYAPYDAESNMYHHLDVQLAWDTWQTASEHSVKPSAQPSAESMPNLAVGVDAMSEGACVTVIHRTGSVDHVIYSKFHSAKSGDTVDMEEMVKRHIATPPTVDQDGVKDAEIYRQWFDAVQDLSPNYLELRDYEMANALYLKLGMRVPSSITDFIIAAECLANHPASTDQSIESEKP